MGKATPFPKKAATSEEDAQFGFIPLEYPADWRHFGLANQKFSKHQKTILSAGKRDISFPDPGKPPGVAKLFDKFLHLFPGPQIDRIIAKPLDSLSRSEIHHLTGA